MSFDVLYRDFQQDCKNCCSTAIHLSFRKNMSWKK